MIKAVIFDMDGTMVNSEELWKEVNSQLAREYNVVFDEVIQKQMTGRKEDDALSLFIKYFHLTADVDSLQQKRKKMLLKNLNKISVNKGVFELLDLLDSLHIKKAVATSSFRYFATAVLQKIHAEARFDFLICGDQVKNGKPHPEIFLTAANNLNVSPSESLVLEDAQNGVEAAYNAGMNVFAIPHQNSIKHDFSKATRILTSMLEINEDTLRQ